MEAEVQKFSLKGYGIADEVEIAHVIPGDKILFELTRKKRLPQKGRLLEILESSPDRVVPKCSHAQTCGGCSWQQMDYSAQLKEKQRRVQNAFNVEPDPIIPCEKVFGYRNKMEFTFSENRAGQKYLGLMIAQAEPYVFNLTECHLTSPWFAEVVSSVRAFWESSSIQAYFPPADRGALRYLTLREAVNTGQRMAILNVSGNPEYALTRKDLDQFTKAIQAAAGETTSVFLRIHQTKKGRPTHFYEMHLAGPDHIVEELPLKNGRLSFKISPISFFQPNPTAAVTLYDTAIAMLHDVEIVYDLYCGTGTLGMAASKRAKTVIGIELSPEAVIDAEENLKRNQISNMRVIQGDVGKVITKLMGEPSFKKPDAVIVDPPRAGLDPLALHLLKSLLPQTIVYISCNPLTQAENVSELEKVGYRLKRLQPIDQFPHTYHIENIALLERSSSN